MWECYISVIFLSSVRMFDAQRPTKFETRGCENLGLLRDNCKEETAARKIEILRRLHFRFNKTFDQSSSNSLVWQSRSVLLIVLRSIVYLSMTRMICLLILDASVVFGTEFGSKVESSLNSSPNSALLQTWVIREATFTVLSQMIEKRTSTWLFHSNFVDSSSGDPDLQSNQLNRIIEGRVCGKAAFYGRYLQQVVDRRTR